MSLELTPPCMVPSTRSRRVVLDIVGCILIQDRDPTPCICFVVPSIHYTSDGYLGDWGDGMRCPNRIVEYMKSSCAESLNPM